ncbi:MAG: phage protease [Planktomarina sp.]
MTEHTSIQIAGLALNTTQGAAPDWIQLLPAGPSIKGRDGRRWVMSDPQAIVDAFNRTGIKLPIDFEHATQVRAECGQRVDAEGWIEELALRGGEVWGKVEWFDAAKSAVAAQAYRYISPVFTFDPQTREIGELRSAGLTNTPNLKLAALNKPAANGEPEMDKTILDALGLEEGADADAVVTAINSLKEDKAIALNRAQTPDPEKFVPKADHVLALNKIRDFEKADADRKDAAITAAVDAAIEGGKVAPASREYHVAACRAEGGLEAFNKMVEAAPQIAPPSGLDGKEPPKCAVNKLTDEELAACHALGMTSADFLAAKNGDQDDKGTDK